MQIERHVKILIYKKIKFTIVLPQFSIKLFTQYELYSKHERSMEKKLLKHQTRWLHTLHIILYVFILYNM